jgi:two-component system probable response regulator PhcQ
MTDQRMPGEKGVWLLEQARQLRPQILRILVTAYTDMDAAIEAVNSGAIYKYVTKPWNPPLLEQMLKRGLDFFELQLEREELLKERSALLRERMIANRIGSLGLVAAGLSQNIRNSMVTVKTFLDLAEEKSGAGSLCDPDLLRSVRADIEKVIGLLADLRIVSPNPNDTPFADEIALPSLIGEILAARQASFAARRIEVKNRIPADLPPLRGDRHMLQRLFELLFIDELAMLPAGNRLTLSGQVSEFRDHPAIAITVVDDGNPLPPDILEFVLNPMATKVSPSEFGIHLLICFFIVHHHGGTIEATNQSGGNQFVIKLPLLAEPVSLRKGETEFFKKSKESA